MGVEEGFSYYYGADGVYYRGDGDSIEPLDAGQLWYGTEFIYDNRGRLIRETREAGQPRSGRIAFVYDLEYHYDQLGNRTSKTDHLSGA